MKTSATFHNLPIGATFDFISPDRMLNSFHLRCTKISARRYRDECDAVHRIGSVRVNVYHVEPAAV